MANNKIMRFVVTAVVLVALMTLTAFAADITGGFGAIGGVDDTYYAAPATLNAAGDALALGDAIQLTTANNTGLAGLYAVSTDSTFEGDYKIVYVYGDMADRKDITERNTYVGGGDLTDTDNGSGYGTTYPKNPVKLDGSKTYVVGVDADGDGFDDNLGKRLHSVGSGENAYLRVWNWHVLQVDCQNSSNFVVGKYTGVGVNNYAWGSWSAKTVGRTGGYEISKALNDAFVNAAGETEKTEAFNNIVDATKNIAFRYALTGGEIVPVSEVNSYSYQLEMYKMSFVSTDHVVKFEAYIADADGKVSVYSYLHNTITLSSTKATLTVDFENPSNGAWKNALPKQGYLVGIKVIPYHGLTEENYTTTVQDQRVMLHTGSYSIDTPKAKKPTGLGVDANGALTGTIPGMTYEYATVSSAAMLNGTALTYTTVDVNTALTDAGLYAVRVAGVDGEYAESDIVVLYVPGTQAERQDILERTTWATNNYLEGKDADGNGFDDTYTNNAVKTVGTKVYVVATDDNGDGFDDNVTDKRIAFLDNGNDDFYYIVRYQGLRINSKNSTSFSDGYLTAKGISSYFWGTWADYHIGVTAGRNISSGVLSAYVSASEEDKKAAFDAIVAEVEDFNYAYALPGKEIVPVAELNKYTYALDLEGASITYTDYVVKFEAFVMNDKGEVNSYTYLHNAYNFNGDKKTLVVDFADVKNGSWTTKPTEGYFIGFKIWPFHGMTDATKFSTTNSSQTNLMFVHVPSGYVLKTAYDTPVLAVETGANKSYTELTISNFKAGTTYAYSTDEGATWTEFTTATLKFTEANKYYWVKALGDAEHFESEIAVPAYPSAAVIYKGTSLVLDGKIGIRIYFDVDKSALNYTMLKHTVTNGDDSVEYAKSITAINYEADDRTAYVTVYVAPKDYNDVTVKVNQLLVANKVTGKSGSIINTIPEMMVSDYITAFYGQVEAGNEACIAANDLVEALEAYCENADAYFDTEAGALDTVEADAAAIAAITAPQKEGKFTHNGSTILEHYSSSLILEENVVIRHYFKATAVEGQPTFTTETVTATETNGKAVAFNPANYKASTTTDGVCYYYVDITNIDAKNLDTQYELNLTMGDETITVKYSALNYVKQTYNDTTTTALTKLSNLVKAIYNYSVEAESYVK